MYIQKKDRKQPEIVHKDRGDMIRKQKMELQSTPRDRGDVKIKRNKKNTRELSKTTKSEKAESLKIPELLSRSTNTFAESVPVNFENRAKHVDASSEKCVDFRKRIKDRYTFKRQQKVERKDGDISKFNYAMQYDVKHEMPKASLIQSSEKQNPKESHEVTKFEKLKDKATVHRAVSAMKLNPTLTKRNQKEADKEKMRNSTRKDRQRKPVIKTITSKMDTVRVFKAVTFVENVQRKPLQIKIPNKDPKPKKSRIPVSVSKTFPSKLLARFVKAERIQSPSSKSAGSLETEVAQWVPDSVNQHTKPYYEAWVNKTATASSKYTKEEMESVKSTVLRALEMRRSPELVYQGLAEEYAGKIRVRRKGKVI